MGDKKRKAAKCNYSIYVPPDLNKAFTEKVEKLHGRKCFKATVIRTLMYQYVNHK